MIWYSIVFSSNTVIIPNHLKKLKGNIEFWATVHNGDNVFHVKEYMALTTPPKIFPSGLIP